MHINKAGTNKNSCILKTEKEKALQ